MRKSTKITRPFQVFLVNMQPHRFKNIDIVGPNEILHQMRGCSQYFTNLRESGRDCLQKLMTGNVKISEYNTGASLLSLSQCIVNQNKLICFSSQILFLRRSFLGKEIHFVALYDTEKRCMYKDNG